MKSKLAAMREKLAQLEQEQSGSGSGDKTSFKFWNMPDDSSTVVRFLPDGNEDNVFFWVEKQVIRMPFPGIKGYDEHKEITVQIPCMEMWGEKCPVHDEIRPWFNKGQEMEDLARKYWKKRTYIFQGFVVDSKLKEEEPPENPIRRFNVGPQIFKIIKSALMNPDLEDIPTDYDAGRDFKISKARNGKFSDYGSSSWSLRQRPLSDAEREAIDKFGLTNLNDALPKKPTQEEVNIIFEMFEASVNGELYDPERWANHFKPYGFKGRDDEKSEESKQQKAAPAPKKEEIHDVEDESDDDEAVVEPKKEQAPQAKPSAQDILNKIRERQKPKA